jgi:hypothetical protein
VFCFVYVCVIRTFSTLARSCIGTCICQSTCTDVLVSVKVSEDVPVFHLKVVSLFPLTVVSEFNLKGVPKFNLKVVSVFHVKVVSVFHVKVVSVFHVKVVSVNLLSDAHAKMYVYRRIRKNA